MSLPGRSLRSCRQTPRNRPLAPALRPRRPARGCGRARPATSSECPSRGTSSSTRSPTPTRGFTRSRAASAWRSLRRRPVVWAAGFYEHADGIHHRGAVAVALAAATHDGAAELWLDGKPWVFLGDRTQVLPPWLLAHLAGCSIWFTYDGASLHALRSVRIVGGLYIVDLERVVA